MKTHKELIVIIKTNGQYELDYREIKTEIEKKQLQLQTDLYNLFLVDEYEALWFLGFMGKHMHLSEPLRFLFIIASTFINKLSSNPDIEVLRENTQIDIEIKEIDLLISKSPYLNGMEYFNIRWINRVFKELHNVFHKKIKEFNGSVKKYFLSFNPELHVVGRVFFHLVESDKKENPFSFLATYSADVSKNGKAKHLALNNALIEYGENSDRLLQLLSTVKKAAIKSELINGLVDSGKIFHPVSFSSEMAYTFLKEIDIYEEMGILCRIPKWWKSKKNESKVSIGVNNDTPSHLGANSILNFNIKLSIGGQEISKTQILKLIEETEGLAFIKGKWVEVNHAKLEETLHAYEQAQKLTSKKNISIIEALQFQMNANKILKLDETSDIVEVTNGQWLQEIVSKLVNPHKIKEIGVGKNFNATLRKYQERGLNWLYFMKQLGLGACLADDMGLGKTIQVIALLNYIRITKNEKTLLIIPASLIGNWISELEKFTPDIKYYVMHASKNSKINIKDEKIIKAHEFFITTYTMAKKIEWLHEMTWDTIILDEAQAIKNPKTKQSMVIKKINARHKIALTGTPIENRLSDLWSLFDFLNKGLLGTPKEFNDFVKLLKENNEGYSRLKNAVNPFILRRLKTDKNIISDLPDKIEMKTYSTLTKKQGALYQDLVNSIKKSLEKRENGAKRNALILTSIIKFKQICNHPSQYLGQEIYLEKESGKFKRLREICEIIYAKRERVLVFTQFRELTSPLKDFLEQVFKHKGLMLHGGTKVSKRKDIVDKFQGHEYVPFIVISIKAGGVGLNLTAANHVIHFDRWWNPAVENQATDRVFRIGQSKNVLVHKFITEGTIEEKIDFMIEDKVKLSKEVISNSQQSNITKMSNAQLMELFSLK